MKPTLDDMIAQFGGYFLGKRAVPFLLRRVFDLPVAVWLLLLPPTLLFALCLR